MHWTLLAQESDDLFRWAVIAFVVVSSILSGIGNMIKKRRGKLDDDDIDEDDDTVIILRDELRPASPPPVARRARPPVPPTPGDRPPTSRPAVRPSPPRPAASRPPQQRPGTDRPLPSRRPLPAEKAKQRPSKRPVGALADYHGAIDHAKHITKHADGVGDHAKDVGTLDDRFAKTTRSRQIRRKGLDVSRKGLRQAIVLNEILSPPLALRDADDAPGMG